MKTQLLLFCLLFACLSSNLISAKTIVQKRGDKISEHFKQLAPEEIDPNVAPPEPEKVDSVDPTDDISSGSGGTSAQAVEEAAAEEDSTANEVVDEAANEIEGQQAEEAAAAAPQQAVATATPKPAAVQTPTSTPGAPAEGLSKYCKCTDNNCDCCRDIGIPLLPLRSQGCAKVSYLGNEKMSVSIRYGDITLATRTISGKKAKPICVGLPGGYNSFCGRVYGLSKAKEDFKACLGFELRAEDEIEAALRVSCFKFGPEGLRVAEAEPLPSEVNKEEEDDDDFFGLGGDDGDDDDYEAAEADADDDEEEEADDDSAEAAEPEAPEDADYGGFSLGALFDELAEDEEDAPAAAAVKPTPSPSTTRNVVNSQNVQSKDDKGSEAAAAADAVVSAEEAAAAAAAAASAVTPLPAAAGEGTTIKSKKSKKTKKNKKKTTSATSETESGFAYELINGILDFFN